MGAMTKGKILILSVIEIRCLFHAACHLVTMLAELTRPPYNFEILLFIRVFMINPLKPELNPICYLLALLGAHHLFHVSRIRVKLLTLR